MPWVDGIRGKYFLKSKQDDLYDCHRSCEFVFDDPWLKIDKSICKRDCNDKFPSNEEQCRKVCTHNLPYPHQNCVDKCVSQMSERSHEHICDDDKCVIVDTKGTCGLKIVDVGCSITECESQDSQTKTYAIGGYDPKFGKILLESKAEDLHNCHRYCENTISSWNPVGRAVCKNKCNDRFPTDEKQCDEVMGNSKCAVECKSAMSTISELSRLHAADEIQYQDSMSI